MSDNSPIYRLTIPASPMRLKRNRDAVMVFDSIRRRYVRLTPEEFVRQQFTSWMVNSLHYPHSLLANEIGIRLNGTLKRCDTVVFNNDTSILMIIEYKAPEVSITQEVFNQIVRYNMVLKADYLVVSNGLHHYCCKMDYNKETYAFLTAVPDYRDIAVR